MSPLALIQHTGICLAVFTSFGVLVHDTKIDAATTAALAVPLVAAVGFDFAAQSKLGNESHTHVERVSLANAVRDLHAGSPRIQPRDDNKKYHLQKNVVRGVHGFDGYHLPA